MTSHNNLCDDSLHCGLAVHGRLFYVVLMLLSSHVSQSEGSLVGTAAAGHNVLNPSSLSEADHDKARNLLEIVASANGEFTFVQDGAANAPIVLQDGSVIENAQEATLPGPGCSFVDEDGDETTFVEGESMGTFRTIDTCANNVPEAFPCYCISGARDQTVCPYCVYRDAFNQNICGSSGETTAVLHRNGTMLSCQCTVTVKPVGGLYSVYSVRVSSNCERVDPEDSGFVIDVTAPPTTTAASATVTIETSVPIVTESLTLAPTSLPIVMTPLPTWTTLPIPIITSTPQPTLQPTATATATTTSTTTTTTTTTTSVPIPSTVTYQPGNLTIFNQGLYMSQGLSVRILAVAGSPVTYEAAGGGTTLSGTTTIALSRQDEMQSQEPFHSMPDGAMVFLDNRPSNPNGWIWVSNSEVSDGGAGAVTFNALGQVIDYRRILTGTMWNCNGGRTPWGTWVSAEEDMDHFQGKLWQVDPYGVRQPEALTLGMEGGAFEAFAYDVRDLSQPHFFVTEDDEMGALRRWTPYLSVWGTDPWSMLHGPGLTEYLVLEPDFQFGDGSSGTFSWVTDEIVGRNSAKDYYPYSEGIDVHGNILTFICKEAFVIFQLNLDTYVYQRTSTQTGLFDGQPDQVRTIIQDDGSAWLYFSEDDGRIAGIHARDENGNFFTILEAPGYTPETTGTTFSPDGKHMYFTIQEDGYMFDVTRDDGLSFLASTVNLKVRSGEAAPYRRRRQR